MFGRNLLTNNTIPPTRVSADGSPEYKTGGVTLDWTTVAALGADANLPDGGVVLSGQKYLRYGQILTRITATSKFGPYDPGAADGRQLLVIGECFILDETITQYAGGISGISVVNDQFGSCIEGGRIFIDRVLQSGVAAHTLALGPTLAEFTAAFPNVFQVKQQ